VTGEDMIDVLIQFYLDIGQPTANDTAFRARCLFHVQRAVDELWNFRPWPMKATPSVNITIATTGIGDLPTDFGGPGYVLTVNNPDGKYKLEWMAPKRLFDLRERETGRDSRPRWYTLADENQTVGASLGLQQIHVHKRPLASLVLHIGYELQSPQIADNDGSITPSGMEFIPLQYHSTVVFEGAKAYLMEDEGDGRAPMVRARFRRFMMEMWAQEKQTTHTPRRSPRYAAAMLGRRLWR
jgi:hypothetical protein